MDDLPRHSVESKINDSFEGIDDPVPANINGKLENLAYKNITKTCKSEIENQIDLELNKQSGSQILKAERDKDEDPEIQKSIFTFEIENITGKNNAENVDNNIRKEKCYSINTNSYVDSKNNNINDLNDIYKMNRNSEDIQDFIKSTIGQESDGGTPFFTVEELKRFLNLRMIGFSDMPKSPLKIGEASFSEVFRINGSIYKIIPFNEWYGIESFCKEVFVLEALKDQKGICRIVDKFTIKGRFSKEYIKSWELYAKNNESENAHPTEYKSSQIFGVVVMEDCGTPFEKYQFRDYPEILSFIDQLLETIATLEKCYRFEHRDLHWGNILIKDSEIFLIDFNFARMEAGIDGEKGQIVDVLDISYDKCLDGKYKKTDDGTIIKILFTDLKREEWMFEGDSSVDLQFEVYKNMKRACRDDWENFNEKSNLLWVIYLLDKLFLKIKDLKVSYDRFKCAKLVQELVDKSKMCSNTEELLEFYKTTLISSSCGLCVVL